MTITRALALAVLVLTSSFTVHATEALEVTLKNPGGETIGTARLTQLKQGVKIELRDVKLTAGTKAFHFHEKGECKAPDFSSAGSHYAPEKHEHGFDAAKGHHAGDMPNLVVGASGVLNAEVINTKVTLRDGKASLRKKGGTALVIHAQADDYKSQPAGNAGDRIACGEIPAR